MAGITTIVFDGFSLSVVSGGWVSIATRDWLSSLSAMASDPVAFSIPDELSSSFDAFDLRLPRQLSDLRRENLRKLLELSRRWAPVSPFSPSWCSSAASPAILTTADFAFPIVMEAVFWALSEISFMVAFAFLMVRVKN